MGQKIPIDGIYWVRIEPEPVRSGSLWFFIALHWRQLTGTPALKWLLNMLLMLLIKLHSTLPLCMYVCVCVSGDECSNAENVSVLWRHNEPSTPGRRLLIDRYRTKPYIDCSTLFLTQHLSCAHAKLFGPLNMLRPLYDKKSLKKVVAYSFFVTAKFVDTDTAAWYLLQIIWTPNVDLNSVYTALQKFGITWSTGGMPKYWYPL